MTETKQILSRPRVPSEAVPLENFSGAVEQREMQSQIATTVPLAPDAPPIAPTSNRSDPKTFQLHDGRWIVMEPPKASISVDVNTVQKETEFADLKLANQDKMQIRSLLYIKSIDGRAIERPRNAIMREALEQELGVDGTDQVFVAWMTFWPPLDDSWLKTVKKS
jgi:hypothetical protein